jgi:hypothetical protein
MIGVGRGTGTGAAIVVAVLLGLGLAACGEKPAGTASTPAASTSDRVAQAEAALPLFSPDKKTGFAAFAAGVKSLPLPPSVAKQEKSCSDFVSDLVAGNAIDVHQPNYAGPDIEPILGESKLDHCPREIFGNPPSPFTKLNHDLPPGRDFERYEIYNERTDSAALNLFAYRKARFVENADGSKGLRTVEVFSKLIDPTRCRGGMVIGDWGSSSSATINEDQGLFVLSWRHFPLVADLSHQIRKNESGAETELWTLAAQSQVQTVMHLSCFVTWQK